VLNPAVFVGVRVWAIYTTAPDLHAEYSPIRLFVSSFVDGSPPFLDGPPTIGTDPRTEYSPIRSPNRVPGSRYSWMAPPPSSPLVCRTSTDSLLNWIDVRGAAATRCVFQRLVRRDD
jgi:hypothetical protein